MEEMQLLEKKTELFEAYLNETGTYGEFVRWLKDRGEKPSLIGFEDLDEDEEYDND